MPEIVSRIIDKTYSAHKKGHCTRSCGCSYCFTLAIYAGRRMLAKRLRCARFLVSNPHALPEQIAELKQKLISLE